MNLLVVNEDKSVCNSWSKQIRVALSGEGCNVISCFSGLETMHFLRADVHAVMFVSAAMKSHPVDELIQQARLLQPNIIIVLISDANQALEDRAMLRPGIDRQLVIPFINSELHHMATETVARYRSLSLDDGVTISGSRDDLVAKSRDYAEEHILDGIDMATVANHMNLSYSYFSRVYHERTGETFARYFVRLRMKEVCRQLLEGHQLVDIAASLGYQNSANLTRSFSREFGMPPREWLKQNREK